MKPLPTATEVASRRALLSANGETVFYGWNTTDTAYAGASRIRKELATWNPPMGSADSDLLPDLGTLISRSRDLARNHGIASSAIQTTIDNVVGYGLRLSSTPDYRALGQSKEWAHEWARNTESHFRAWTMTTGCDAADLLNFSGLTSLMFRAMLLNGDAIALPLWLPNRNRNGFATCLQLVESDRLSNPQYATVRENLRGGIETDPYGAPVAYYIRKTHPGDFMLGLSGNFSSGYGSDEWERIPAYTKWGRRRVIRLHEMDRTGQTRGTPLFAPVLEQFKMFDHYQRTELQCAIVNALVAAVIETPMDPASIAEMVGGNPNEYITNKNEYRVQLRGGAVLPLYPGDKFQSFTPSRPAAQYSSFVETVLRHIATGLNMPYELLTKDFSKTTYASARAALLEAWRYFQTRRLAIAWAWCQPVYELWLEEAISIGLVDAPDYYKSPGFYQKAKWLGPGRGWVDPVKEAQAAQIRIENGFSTMEAECAEQGLDWQEQIEQRAVEIGRMKELGIWDDLMQMRAPAQAVQLSAPAPVTEPDAPPQPDVPEEPEEEEEEDQEEDADAA
jgi:lambda family phage portal protein